MFSLLKTIVFIFLVLISFIAPNHSFANEIFPRNKATEDALKEAKEGKGIAYVGSNTCKLCHRIWFKSWEQTGMANSFNLLKPGSRYKAKIRAGLDPDKDYRRDEKCLPCHSVGYNQPGGFTKKMPFSYAKEKGLLGVGCEMCHGHGGKYWQMMPKFKKGEVRESDLIEAGLLLPGRTDKGDLCVNRCHNQKNPFHQPFDFKEKIMKDTRVGGKGIHEHFDIVTLKKHFGGKHDVDLKVNVKYIFKSRKGREIKDLGQPMTRE